MSSMRAGSPRDFTYVDDIVQGVLRADDKVANPVWAGDRPDPATFYNIGNTAPIQ